MTADRTALYRARVHDTRADAPPGDAVLPLSGWPRYVEALASRRVIAAHEVATDDRTRELLEAYCAPLGIASMLDAPLFLTGEVHGIVCHEHVGAPRAWTAREIDFATSVADMLSALLEQSMRLSAERRLRTAREASVAARTAAGIAHDVNTVLQAVSTTVETARRTEDAAARESALRAILEDCRRAGRVLDQLRELERLPVAGGEAIDASVVISDLGATLDAIVAPERTLTFELTPETFIAASRTDIERIVLNLVTNARDATPAGGTIQVRALRARGAAIVEVEDAGTGIATAPSTRIFEPFFTTKGEPHGGLGLFIVAVLSSRSGGAVSVRTEAERGTTFRVTWPLG